ncbi:hypothetical protein [Flavobacterium sp.]|uniref:hypothetical protein n=1 Tax=Flavobacterium sp. TaxID=239 RepID=UPI00262A0171|nr:hypothetical protein [Flavobacterium sp.]
MTTNYKIGYVDENANEVKTYRRKLKKHGFDVIGYEFVKGMSPESLMQQVYNSDIDLLMIDFKLKDSNKVSFNGDVIEHLIYNTKPLFPHVVFTSDKILAEATIEDWKILFDKTTIFPDDDDEEENEETIRFIKILKQSIEQYRKYINVRKERLAALLQKGKDDGLTGAEKDEALSLQEELNNLDQSSRNEIPKHLVSIQTLDNLSESRKKAEEFLQNLKDGNNER